MGGNYIAFYFILLGLVGLFGYFGEVIATGEDFGTLPELDDEPGWFATLGYGFELVTYLFTFQGLTIIGLPSAISFIISFILNVIMLYVLIRLVRGGG